MASLTIPVTMVMVHRPEAAEPPDWARRSIRASNLAVRAPPPRISAESVFQVDQTQKASHSRKTTTHAVGISE